MRNVCSVSQARIRCPHKWLIKYGLGLSSVRWRDKSQKMDLGSIFHLLNAGEEPEGAGVDPEALDRAKAIRARYDEHWILSPFRVFAREQQIVRRVPRGIGERVGPKSPIWQGRVDGLATSGTNGAVFIFETKTTSLPLSTWIEKNVNDNQVAVYALLFWLETGVLPDGAVIDLVNTDHFRMISDLLTKDGELKKVRKGTLPKTDARTFQLAYLGATDTLWNGGNPAPIHECEREWVRGTFTELALRDAEGYWFKRHVVRFTREDLERVCKEVHHDGLRMSLDHERLDPLREHIHAAPTPLELGTRAREALTLVGHRFPRAGSECMKYHRMCEYAGACSTWDATELGILAPRQRGENEEAILGKPDERLAEALSADLWKHGKWQDDVGSKDESSAHPAD